MSFTILVVDDSVVMRGMIKRALTMSGIPIGTIVEAGNGQEALDALAATWVDLALVDINMPVMDGMELLERVRASPKTRDLAIVVVSTESSETRVARIAELGADFVHKPFTPEELRQTILRVTGISHEDATVAAHSSDSLDF